MALTLTVGALSATTAATLAQVAGVAGLASLGALAGVAGAAKLSGGGRRRGRGGRRHHGRKRRQAGAPKKVPSGGLNEIKKPLVKDGVLDEEVFLDLLIAGDEDRCSQRVVCELAADQERLGKRQDLVEVLRFVKEGNPVAPGVGGLSRDNPRLQPFQKAAKLGAEGVACEEIFSSCSSVSMAAVWKSLL